MNSLEKCEFSAFAFAILGGVWGIFLIQLGIPPSDAVNVAIYSIIAAGIMCLIGAVLAVKKIYDKDDGEGSE